MNNSNPQGWKECKLGECLEKVIDNRGKTPPVIETITPYGLIEVNALAGDSKFPNYSAIRKYVSKETYEAWFRCGHPRNGDVLFATVGTIAEVAILNENKGSIAQNLIALRPNNNVLVSDFLYYHFITPSIKQSLISLDISSVQPSIKVPHLLDTIIILPPLPEQRAIAGVLSRLDDKIDLLHRQNKTLERMAEALWQKMFIEEADPGWKKGKLGDVAEINPLRSIKKGAIAAYLDMSNMPTNGPFPKEWIQREFTSGIKFKNGDTIIARITPCLENGKTAYVNFLRDGEIGWGSTEYIILIPKSGYCPEWNYFLARNADFRDFAIQNMTGTSGRQRVSGDSIAQYEIAIPTVNISEKFRTFAGPVMEHIRQNSFQIRTLSHLRDTLLPKLMSGEVRVKL